MQLKFLIVIKFKKFKLIGWNFGALKKFIKKYIKHEKMLP